MEELEALAMRLSLEDANKKRAFFEKHVIEARNSLTQAAQAVQSFQEKHGLAHLEMQGGLAVSASSQLRAQIALKEIELASLGAFATHSNPNVVRTREEIRALQRELARVDSKPTK